MATEIDCVLIEWVDVLDKDVTDSSKWIIRNKDYKPGFLPVSGLEEKYEVFVRREPYTQPPVDYRLFDLVISETPEDTLDDEHTSNRKWVTTYSLVDKDLEVKLSSVDDTLTYMNSLMFPQNKRELIQLLYPIVKAMEVDGQEIGIKQQYIIDKYEAYGQRAYQNYVIAQKKKEDLTNGISIDIDSDFNATDPTV